MKDEINGDKSDSYNDKSYKILPNVSVEGPKSFATCHRGKTSASEKENIKLDDVSSRIVSYDDHRRALHSPLEDR